ncbi:transporter substrate-binding domain-containing protein [Collinsella sp. AGMB00827]|uniref:Transporter substrate-binding domain-containing protein n=1 Tax=Collinsella ureilytica TaxID=2869515 RepID=A0ABS7MK71_9ACTN|nr:transporter substrate-binding domain-containing protein [Collinsella urealyticum]MBY4797485.1 transporter substrate-binding domain-containing protein [Collinsella urealyticum]
MVCETGVVMRDLGEHRFSRFAVAVCATLAIGSLCGCSLLTPTRAEVPEPNVRVKLTAPVIETEGVLTVGLPSNSAPQAFTAKDGKLTGYSVDVARALARRLGLKVSFVIGADPGSVGDPGAPDIFLGAPVAGALEEGTIVGTYLEDAPALFAMSDRAQQKSLSLQDLNGVRIAVQSGSSSKDVLSKCGIQAEEISCTNVNDCLEAVIAGKADYAACSVTTGAYLARMHTGLKFVCTIDEATTYGVRMKAKNRELISEISDAMDTLASNGVLDAIRVAWYGHLPETLEGTMVSGISTTSERKAETERQKSLNAPDRESSSREGTSTRSAASDHDEDGR